MNELVLYFNAKGELDLLMLVLNGLLASAIFLLLIRPADGPIPLYARIVRAVSAAAYGFMAARIWLGWYLTPVEPTELASNGLMLALVLVVGSDASVLLDAVRYARNARTRKQGKLAT